jgi:predicted AAA+ superfamily ATPase
MWNREAQKNLRALLRQFPCACILGARQVGKTTLAKATFPRADYHDLESPSLRERVRLAPESFLKDASRPVVLDEIQFVPELWEYLKVEIDSRRTLKGRFLVLGSAHPDLVRKASESLAGRIGFLDLDPLVPNETNTGTPALDIEDIWVRGGYPEAAKLKRAEARNQWMESYIRTFIERDLPGEGVEANPSLMRKLLIMVAHVHGGTWNASQLAASAGVSYHTVNRYRDILERSFLIRRIQPYFTNIGKRLVKSPKVYIRDSGLYHHLMGLSRKEDLLNSPQCGASWEGFLLETVIRHAHLVNPGIGHYFYRTQRGLEADLVLQYGKSLAVIEMKFGSRLEKRWVESVRAVMDDIGASKGAIIHSGGESFAVDGRVKVYAAKDAAYLDEMLPR